MTEMRFSAGHLPTGPTPAFLELVRRAEALEYDTFFVADHATKQNPYAMLAAAAVETDRIGLGTGVTNPYSRNPLLSAAAIATIDRLSGGRSILGMGAGGHGIEPFGYDQSNPIGALADAVDVIRRLHAGETVSATTDRYSLHDAHLEFEVDREIPIYLAGRGPQLLKLAGAVADGAIAGAGLTSVEAMQYAKERVALGAEEADRDPDGIDVACWAFLSIARDREVALDAVAPFTATLVQDAVPRESLESLGIPAEDIDDVLAIDDVGAADRDTLRETVSREIVELFSIAGTPERCLEHVEGLRQSGVSHVAVLPFENDENDAAGSLELFADGVIGSLA